MNKMTETFKLARKNMVLNQLRPNKIKEENILKAFESIPKENYLADNIQKSCYLDNDIDITKKRGYLKNNTCPESYPRYQNKLKKINFFL